nr:MAG TPA: hypothetical protein [Caudoviricetes sp.]
MYIIPSNNFPIIHVYLYGPIPEVYVNRNGLPFVKLRFRCICLSK